MKREKRASLLLWILMWVTVMPLSAQNVSIDVSMPGKAVAGKAIPVTVVIHKGDYSDFARFRQVLPGGFDVKPQETANSDFSLKNRELNFIWLKLPREEVITLKYDLIPDKQLRGVFQISGLFSYIKDQERQEMDIPRVSIEILPSDGDEVAAVPAATAVKTATSAEMTALKAPRGPVVFRGTPVMGPDGKGWVIRLIVNRGSLEKLGRLEEVIPEGYLPENINGRGAIFSFKEGLVKYIWMNFPEDSVFEVSYKLVPMPGMTPPAPPHPTGYFSYMKDNDSQRSPVRSLDAEVPAGAGEATLYALMAATVAGGEQAMTTTAAEPSAVSPAATGQSVEEKAVTEATTVPAVHTSENKPGQPTQIVQHAPQQDAGIYFRVQLMASSRPVETENYFRKHNVPGKIYREYANGLYKYTTGSFASYREARNFVDRLKETTDIDKAFVTAYDNGRRITVREALNRTGQKWFK